PSRTWTRFNALDCRVNPRVKPAGGNNEVRTRQAQNAPAVVAPRYGVVNGWPVELAPLAGAVVAATVAILYGLPTHVIVAFGVLLCEPALGVMVGPPRLFSPHSFATSPRVEGSLIFLGCRAIPRGPFHWVAPPRTHHRHSDRDGDPHSPHFGAGRPLGAWRG